MAPSSNFKDDFDDYTPDSDGVSLADDDDDDDINDDDDDANADADADDDGDEDLFVESPILDPGSPPQKEGISTRARNGSGMMANMFHGGRRRKSKSKSRSGQLGGAYGPAPASASASASATGIPSLHRGLFCDACGDRDQEGQGRDGVEVRGDEAPVQPSTEETGAETETGTGTGATIKILTAGEALGVKEGHSPTILSDDGHITALDLGPGLLLGTRLRDLQQQH